LRKSHTQQVCKCYWTPNSRRTEYTNYLYFCT